MKKYDKFMIIIVLIIICILGSQLIMRQFLPDFKGTIVHEEITNSQSFSIDRDIIMSLWDDYSESLPALTLSNDGDYQKLAKDFQSILKLYTQSQPESLDNIFSSMKMNNTHEPILYLKDYMFQTEDKQSYLIDYICSNQDFLYYHVESKEKKTPTKEQKQNAILFMNEVNTHGLEADYISNQNKNPFINAKLMFQGINELSQSKYLSGLPLINENIFTSHFYTMEYEDELLLVFIPNEELDLETFKANKQNTNFILFYNIIDERFSGFLLKGI